VCAKHCFNGATQLHKNENHRARKNCSIKKSKTLKRGVLGESGAAMGKNRINLKGHSRGGLNG